MKFKYDCVHRGTVNKLTQPGKVSCNLAHNIASVVDSHWFESEPNSKTRIQLGLIRYSEERFGQNAVLRSQKYLQSCYIEGRGNVFGNHFNIKVIREDVSTSTAEIGGEPIP